MMLMVGSQATATLDEFGNGARLSVAFFQGLLAELEYETLRADSALRSNSSGTVNNYATVSFLHRLRGSHALMRGQGIRCLGNQGRKGRSLAQQGEGV